MDWVLKDLAEWNDKIEEIAQDLGLDYYPQEFEVCDYHDMLGYQSYVGMPSRYPHWSFGKSFEKQNTMYKLGMGGLAYEMVINSNPCLAYLMIDNPLAMQILVMAHVYGHNDFFKNNINFSHTRAEFALETFKLNAERIRSYVETPSIGYQGVEKILDAAHAISFHVDRNQRIVRLSEDQQRQQYFHHLNKEKENWDDLKNEEKEDDFIPALSEDLLLFILENSRFLQSWEKDILRIVREETLYFLPQMETKIMNEGWASFWHYTILHKLNLPPAMHVDFIRSHNQVIRPHVGGLNPYHIGFHLMQHLAGTKNSFEEGINPQIFDIRTIDRDSSFLRRFLTQDLMEELGLFEYEQNNGKVSVSNVSNDFKGWKEVRDTLIKQVGTGSIPIIKVKGVSPLSNALLLVHEFDGRELELGYVSKTMEHISTLWSQFPVHLETQVENQEVTCIYEKGNFRVESNSEEKESA
ncbi:SpoVR family protein [Flammeovirga yaeyamensis]|uniref:SpoVR family protein n=1 Tax=Flammeovirga yaeyamensis TaxID=367791 RepID=A0AAX1N571_9BACT|nr:SpoVR family protein [Flammeovirga yaeyamensis]MBB3698628.1 stage V sporulation protein R [Flammeovirga yaeyamensis]NMF34025.1 SpoVR family protein [Flammeovirga yaeyamensis]QWG01013.1 SpoVR family protein [Flammeovirga yaeyamensis]